MTYTLPPQIAHEIDATLAFELHFHREPNIHDRYTNARSILSDKSAYTTYTAHHPFFKRHVTFTHPRFTPHPTHYVNTLFFDERRKKKEYILNAYIKILLKKLGKTVVASDSKLLTEMENKKIHSIQSQIKSDVTTCIYSIYHLFPLMSSNLENLNEEEIQNLVHIANINHPNLSSQSESQREQWRTTAIKLITKRRLNIQKEINYFIEAMSPAIEKFIVTYQEFGIAYRDYVRSSASVVHRSYEYLQDILRGLKSSKASPLIPPVINTPCCHCYSFFSSRSKTTMATDFLTKIHKLLSLDLDLDEIQQLHYISYSAGQKIRAQLTLEQLSDIGTATRSKQATPARIDASIQASLVT